MGYGRLFIAVLLFALTPALSEAVEPDWSVVERKLSKAGFQPAFVQSLKGVYEPRDFKSVVELNTLLFLRTKNDHDGQANSDSAAQVRAFIEHHRTTLDQAQAQHGVSSSVVASLLYIESRYGQNPGRYHVPSIYAHLLQSDREDVIQHLGANGASRFTQAKLGKKELAKIRERAKKKSKWALDEMRAVEKMYNRNASLALNLRGSFAGAFGMPQFIPSSYNRWAKAADGKSAPDLLRPDDAIHSVAYYLRRNGWQPNKSKSRIKALMHYNNSRDYADAILKLADQAEGRSVASDTSEPIKRAKTRR
jgi:membrane-bound lytic murein transglycosylase B